MSEDGKRGSSLLELIIVIVLGITAVATAWSAWQGSLYASQQNEKYTEATRLTAEANSMYNEAANYMSQDMNIWNQIVGLRIDLEFAEDNNNADEVEKIEYKLDQIMTDNVGDNFSNAIQWADSQQDYASPFDKEDFITSYFDDASAVFDEADAAMQAGRESSANADKQGLISVLFAVVLFLLGIAATLKVNNIKIILLVLSSVGFVGATAFMLTIPIILP